MIIRFLAICSALETSTLLVHLSAAIIQNAFGQLPLLKRPTTRGELRSDDAIGRFVFSVVCMANRDEPARTFLNIDSLSTGDSAILWLWTVCIPPSLLHAPAAAIVTQTPRKSRPFSPSGSPSHSGKLGECIMNQSKGIISQILRHATGS